MSRTRKSVIAILAALVLCVNAFCALSETCHYQKAQNFLDLLDEAEILYTYVEYDEESGLEFINIEFESEYYEHLSLDFFFAEDAEGFGTVSLRVPVLEAKADKVAVLEALNTLNNDYMLTKFCFDSTDNTISYEMDSYCIDEDAGIIAADMMVSAVTLLEDEAIVAALKNLA